MFNICNYTTEEIIEMSNILSSRMSFIDGYITGLVEITGYTLDGIIPELRNKYYEKYGDDVSIRFDTIENEFNSLIVLMYCTVEVDDRYILKNKQVVMN